jgi:hypothetical protein
LKRLFVHTRKSQGDEKQKAALGT